MVDEQATKIALRNMSLGGGREEKGKEGDVEMGG
jgi:hypothetical protein